MFEVNNLNLEKELVSLSLASDKSNTTETFARSNSVLSMPSRYQDDKYSISLIFDLEDKDSFENLSSLVPQIDSYPFIFISSERFSAMNSAVNSNDVCNIYMLSSISISMSANSLNLIAVNLQVYRINHTPLMNGFSFIGYSNNISPENKEEKRIIEGLDRPSQSNIFSDFFRDIEKSSKNKVIKRRDSENPIGIKVMSSFFTKEKPKDEDYEVIKYTELRRYDDAGKEIDPFVDKFGSRISIGHDSFSGRESKESDFELLEERRRLGLSSFEDFYYIVWKGEMLNLKNNTTGINVSSFEYRRFNNLCVQRISGYNEPIIQYLGRGEGVFSLTIETAVADSDSPISPYTIMSSLLEQYNANITEHPRFKMYNTIKINSIVHDLVSNDKYVPSQIYGGASSENQRDSFVLVFNETDPYSYKKESLKTNPINGMKLNERGPYSLQEQYFESIGKTVNKLVSRGELSKSILDMTIVSFVYIHKENKEKFMSSEYPSVELLSSFTGSKENKDIISLSSKIKDLVVASENTENLSNKKQVYLIRIGEMNRTLRIPEDILDKIEIYSRIKNEESIDTELSAFPELKNTSSVGSKMSRFRGENYYDLRIGERLGFIKGDGNFLGIRDAERLSPFPFLHWKSYMASSNMTENYFRAKKEALLTIGESPSIKIISDEDVSGGRSNFSVERSISSSVFDYFSDNTNSHFDAIANIYDSSYSSDKEKLSIVSVDNSSRSFRESSSGTFYSENSKRDIDRFYLTNGLNFRINISSLGKILGADTYRMYREESEKLGISKDVYNSIFFISEIFKIYGIGKGITGLVNKEGLTINEEVNIIFAHNSSIVKELRGLTSSGVPINFVSILIALNVGAFNTSKINDTFSSQMIDSVDRYSGINIDSFLRITPLEYLGDSSKVKKIKIDTRDRGTAISSWAILWAIYSSSLAAEPSSIPKVYDVGVDTITSDLFISNPTVYYSENQDKLFNEKAKTSYENDKSRANIISPELQSRNQQSIKSYPSSITRFLASEERLSNARVTSRKPKGLVSDFDYVAFKETIANLETRTSHDKPSRYEIIGGSGNLYFGKYQLGFEGLQTAKLMKEIPASENRRIKYAEKKRRIYDAIHWRSGLSLNKFLKNPMLQEEAYVVYLERMILYVNSLLVKRGKPSFYSMNKYDQAALLGGAHNQGQGASVNYFYGGKDTGDGFGTKVSIYNKAGEASQYLRERTPEELSRGYTDSTSSEGNNSDHVEIDNSSEIISGGNENPLVSILSDGIFSESALVKIQENYIKKPYRRGLINTLPVVRVYIVFGGEESVFNFFYSHEPTFFEIKNVISSSVVMSDDSNPVDLLSLKVSNPGLMYSDDRMLMDQLGAFINRSGIGSDQEYSSITQDILLKAGNKLHVKYGYGNDPNQLETVFNGVITEIDTGEILNIVAESHGREFVKMIYGTDEPYEMTEEYNSGSRKIIAKLLSEHQEIIHFGRKRTFTDILIKKGLSLIGYDSSATENDDPEAKYLYSLAERIHKGGWSGAFSINQKFTKSQIFMNIYSAYIENVDNEYDSVGLFSEIERRARPFLTFGLSKSRYYFPLINESLWDGLRQIPFRHPNTKVRVFNYEHRHTLFHGIEDQLYIAKGLNRRLMQNVASELNSSKVKDRISDIMSFSKYAPVPHIGMSEYMKGSVSETINSVFSKTELSNTNSISVYLRNRWKRMKPVCQYHIACSHTNLIENSLSLNTEYANRLQVYYNDEDTIPPNGIMESAKVLEVSLDDNIRLNDIRTAPLALNTSDGKETALRYGIEGLCQSVSHMYSGKIKLIGNENIKNGDKVYIFDSTRSMNGFVKVSDCIHHYDKHNGYVTEFTPRLITQPKGFLWSYFSLGFELALVNEFTEMMVDMSSSYSRSEIMSLMLQIIRAAGSSRNVANTGIFGTVMTFKNRLINTAKNEGRFTPDQLRVDNFVMEDYEASSLAYYGISYGVTSAILVNSLKSVLAAMYSFGSPNLTAALLTANSALGKAGLGFLSTRLFTGALGGIISSSTILPGLRFAREGRLAAMIASANSGTLGTVFTLATSNIVGLIVKVAALVVVTMAFNAISFSMRTREPIIIRPVLQNGLYLVSGSSGMQSEGLIKDKIKSIGYTYRKTKRAIQIAGLASDQANRPYNLLFDGEDMVETFYE